MRKVHSVLLVILALISLCSSVSHGEETVSDLSYRSINRHNGLPSNTVYDMCQSENYGMFLATENGLVRYNGVDLISLKFEGKGRAIGSVIEDHEGTIWCTNFQGEIFYYNPDNDSLHSFPVKNPFRESHIRVRRFDRSIYIMTSHQLWELKKETRELVKILETKVFFLDMAFGTDGSALALMGGKYREGVPALSIYNINKDTTVRYPISKTFSQGIISPLMVNGALHFFSSNKAALINISVPPNSEDYYIPLESDFQNRKITSAYVVMDSMIAVCSFDGFEIFYPNGKLYGRFLKGISTSRAYEDLEGNLWIGTFQHGVFLVSNPQMRYISMKKHLTPGSQIYKSIKAGDQLFIGTFSGEVLRYNLVTGNVDVCNLNQKSEIQSLWYDEKQNLLYAYCDKIWIIDPETMNVQKKIPFTSCKQIIKVPGVEELFMATSLGFRSLNTETGEQDLIRNRTWANTLIWHPDQNTIWIGTRTGLFTHNLDTKDLSLVSFAEERFNIGSYTNLQINPVNNHIVFLLNQKHIVQLDTDGNTKTIHQSNLVHQFKFDPENPNLLYIRDDNGLFIKNIHTNEIKNLIPNNMFESQSELLDFYRLDNNRWVFMFPEGITYFQKDSDNRKYIRPTTQVNIVSSSFRKDSAAVQWISNYERNFIRLHVESLPNISSAGMNTLYFRIPELDSTWASQPSKNPNINFSKLPYGEYTLQFYSTNEHSIHSDIESVPLLIRAPWYYQTWFIISCILTTLAAGIIIYFYKIRSIRRKALENLRQEQLKLRATRAELTAIRSQMNPHFIFNVLSGIQSKILTGREEEAYENISDFSQLLRNVLEKSGSEFIRLKDEFEVLKVYLNLENSRLQNEQIQYDIQADPSLDLSFLMIPTLITQPFVENAVKHGLAHSKTEKKLRISAHGDEQNLTIRIEDNGIGRKEAAEINAQNKSKPKSFASNAIQQRINALNESSDSPMKIELEIVDLKQGTAVELHIHYKTM